MAEIKRIFITGSPGSMWSGADRQIRFGFGPNADNSDVTDARFWRGHTGVYWHPGSDPGGDWINNFADYNREEIIDMLDSVYIDNPNEHRDYIVRTHKSHNWAYHLDKIETLFPEADIVATVQEPWKCMVWWQYFGGVEHVHDPYDYYHRDVTLVWQACLEQNKLINDWADKHNLPRETGNKAWFERHFYREPDKLFLLSADETPRNCDGIDSWSGRSGMVKGLSNTVKVIIKHGTPRQFK